MRTGAFVGHKCISSLTRSEAKMAGDVLRHSAVPLALASLRPAFNLIILLLNDILVQCTSCGRNMRTGAFVGHECISSLTRREAKMAGDVFRTCSIIVLQKVEIMKNLLYVRSIWWLV